jgi:hypothetical protein
MKSAASSLFVVLSLGGFLRELSSDGFHYEIVGVSRDIRISNPHFSVENSSQAPRLGHQLVIMYTKAFLTIEPSFMIQSLCEASIADFHSSAYSPNRRKPIAPLPQFLQTTSGIIKTLLAMDSHSDAMASISINCP